MAGRPRKLAQAMTRLETDGFCLCADIYLTMPRRYAKPAPTTRREHDPVWEGWRRCTELSVMLHIELLKQTNRLRAKADLEPLADAFDEPPDDGTPNGTPNGKIEPQPAA